MDLENIEYLLKSGLPVDGSDVEELVKHYRETRVTNEKVMADNRRNLQRIAALEAQIKAAQEQEPAIVVKGRKVVGINPAEGTRIEGEFYSAPVPAQQSPAVEQGELIKGECYKVGLWSMRNADAMIEDGNVINGISPAVAVPDENAWIIERLSYHKLERQDMSIDDCLKYLSTEWKEVCGRTTRQLVMQILELLAATTSPRITEQDARDIVLTFTTWRNGWLDIAKDECNRFFDSDKGRECVERLSQSPRITEQEFSDDEYICIRDAVDRLISAVGKDVDGDQSECSLFSEFIDELITDVINPLKIRWYETDHNCGYSNSIERITEQDAREIANHIFGFVGIGNLTAAFDSWFNSMGGRALLDKLNGVKHGK